MSDKLSYIHTVRDPKVRALLDTYRDAHSEAQAKLLAAADDLRAAARNYDEVWELYQQGSGWCELEDLPSHKVIAFDDRPLPYTSGVAFVADVRDDDLQNKYGDPITSGIFIWG